MNVGGVIAVSVFVGAALFLFVPAIWDKYQMRSRGPLVIGRFDWFGLVFGIIGGFMMSLAIGLTFWNGVLLYAGLFVYQIKGIYR